MSQLQLERDYKRSVTSALLFHGIITQEHEDKVSNFIPDLSFSGYGHHGWIEVKWCETLPKTLDGIKHWTLGQEQWLIDRGDKGARTCFLLVGCPTGHYLLESAVLADARWLNIHAALAMASIRGEMLHGLADRLVRWLRRL